MVSLPSATSGSSTGGCCKSSWGYYNGVVRIPLKATATLLAAAACLLAFTAQAKPAKHKETPPAETAKPETALANEAGKDTAPTEPTTEAPKPAVVYNDRDIEIVVTRDGKIVHTETLEKGTRLYRAGVGFVLYEGLYLEGAEKFCFEEPPPSGDAAPEEVWKIGDKTYRSPVIQKEFPRSVLIRHAEGPAYVDKKDIPAKNPTVTAKVEPNKSCPLLLRRYAEKRANGESLGPEWGVERGIERRVALMREGPELGYKEASILDLMTAYKERMRHPLPPTTISFEDDFRKLVEIKDQKGQICGGFTVAAALEYTLKKAGQDVKINAPALNEDNRKVFKRPGKGFTLGNLGWQLAKFGIPTDKGRIHPEFLEKKLEGNSPRELREATGGGGLDQGKLDRVWKTFFYNELILQELSAGRPVIAGCYVPSQGENISDIYLPCKAKNLYPHSVVIVGAEIPANPGKRIRYRFANSWGEKWGDKGYGWITDDLISQAMVQELLEPTTPAPEGPEVAERNAPPVDKATLLSRLETAKSAIHSQQIDAWLEEKLKIGGHTIEWNASNNTTGHVKPGDRWQFAPCSKPSLAEVTPEDLEADFVSKTASNIKEGQIILARSKYAPSTIHVIRFVDQESDIMTRPADTTVGGKLYKMEWTEKVRAEFFSVTLN